MIDLDRTMFFKARFEIEAPQGDEVLWSLVLSVRDWSLRKARRDGDSRPQVKARFEIEAPQGEDVLWSLVLSVRDWSLRKARRDGYSLPQEMRFWSKLKSGEMLERCSMRPRTSRASPRTSAMPCARN